MFETVVLVSFHSLYAAVSMCIVSTATVDMDIVLVLVVRGTKITWVGTDERVGARMFLDWSFTFENLATSNLLDLTAMR